MKLLLIALSAILVDNYVAVRFLGVYPFLGADRNIKASLVFGTAVACAMALSGALIYPIQKFIIDAFDLGYLQILVYVSVILVSVFLIEGLYKKAFASAYSRIKSRFPAVSLNCMILTFTLINFSAGFAFLETVVNSFGAGLGFALVLTMFSAVNDRLFLSDIPKALRGLPITLLAAGMVALAFWGLQGIVKL